MNTSTKKSPSAARLYLKRVSPQLKAQTGATITVNDILTEIYSRAADCGEWGTFTQWKKKGYFVGKGEKGFAVWSRPKAIEEESAESGEKGEDGEDGKVREAFFTAFIFCARQVANREGLRPDGTEYAPSGLIPPHCTESAAIATPAPIHATPQPLKALPAPKEDTKPTAKPATNPAANNRAEYVEQLALAI